MHAHAEYRAQAGGQFFDHGYALLIGVGTTADPHWSLPVTVSDVQAIRKILTDAALCAYPHNADHVRVLCNAEATRLGILDGLAWLKRQAAADPDATVVVYYSGHGWLDAHTLQYALIPHEFDAADIPGTALLADDFAAALRALRPGASWCLWIAATPRGWRRQRVNRHSRRISCKLCCPKA